jgi:hypothetical protein
MKNTAMRLFSWRIWGVESIAQLWLPDEHHRSSLPRSVSRLESSGAVQAHVVRDSGLRQLRRQRTTSREPGADTG